MTSTTPTAILARYAVRLRSTAPKEWDEFLQVFEAYTSEVTVAVTTAPPDAILNKQGQAQAFLHLLDTFKHCPERAQITKD